MRCGVGVSLKFVILAIRGVFVFNADRSLKTLTPDFVFDSWYMLSQLLSVIIQLASESTLELLSETFGYFFAEFFGDA